MNDRNKINKSVILNNITIMQWIFLKYFKLPIRLGRRDKGRGRLGGQEGTGIFFTFLGGGD